MVSPFYLPDQYELGPGLGRPSFSLGPRASLMPGTELVAAGVSGTGEPCGLYLTFFGEQVSPDIQFGALL